MRRDNILPSPERIQVSGAAPFRGNGIDTRRATFYFADVFLRCPTWILLVVCCACAQAQRQAPVLDLTCDGCVTLRTTELAQDLRTVIARPGLSRGDSAMRASVLRHASERGLRFARIEAIGMEMSADSARLAVTLRISEGARVLHGTTRVEGAQALGEATALRALDAPANGLFTEAAVGEAIGRLIARYEQSGYPLVSARVTDLVMRPDGGEIRADVTVTVDEGGLWTVDTIAVEGNTETDPDVIVRETRIQRGELFDAEKVRTARARIERLRFFSTVAEPEFVIRNGRGGLLLRVAEGSTNVFDGVIGYQPPRLPGEEGYLTGLVNVSFRNLFGTGRRFDGRWERATRDVSELDVRYLEPWFLSLPLNLDGGFRERRQDSTYIRRALEARATWLAGAWLNIAATVQQVSVIPGARAASSALSASSTFNAGAELLIDTRDNVFVPRSGVHFRNSYSGGAKRSTAVATGARESDFVQRIELDLSYFLELFPRNIAALSVHGRELRGAALDASDMYQLGGATTLRGYREEQFSGTRLGWVNAEYRFTFGPRSFLFAFFDVGAVYQTPDPTRQRDEFSVTRHGYGIGVRLETGLGVIGVSYALGQGDGLSDGKIHFGLVNEF